ncbi:alpha/beta hydrolase [Vicingus serpentipes]|uniref:Alpha/beta hydrolase n=1 Tax=Vicingus serpentipes TaxID=1926625 RepID=A0A5C6S0L3_9FLAO|nr:alpha/beta hydrolase [Vicingus serpentipes]TXB67142.1 alpha/beta hydrolase [Vicingus serpentipes]
MNYKLEKIQKVQVNDKIELAYEFINIHNEEKPLLIFLHEGLGSIAQWKSFPRELCEKLNLNGLVYERYGYGYSTPFLEKRKPDYLYREGDYFLPLLMKKLGLENKEVILIGHSDGASVALIYAACFPKNIKAVVSMAAHVFVDEQSIKGIKEAYDFYLSGPTLKNALKRYHFDHTDSTFMAWAELWQTPEFIKFNMEHLLPKIEAPILAIQGLQDEYGLPSQITSIVNNGSNANNEALFLEDTKHSPHFEKKEDVINAITKFLLKNKAL